MPQDFMQRALQLATRGRGRTNPNPMVGAVLVKDGCIVGEGYHAKAGESHAEVVALKMAGDESHGAVCYVNIEPCCHYGRTPPCTKALIAGGICEVHMAMLDPNPLVSGRGREELEAAGIRTVVGEWAKEAHQLNEIFIHWITTRRPFVIAKFAMSLDGKIATHEGDSRWISGVESRHFVHELRDEVDAILVGVDTVIKDNPQLTTRLGHDKVDQARHPLRIILDSRGRIPLSAKVLTPQMPGKTLVVTTSMMTKETRQQIEARGVEVLVMADKEGRVAIQELLGYLGTREIASVLVEGGGTVNESFFAESAVDKVLAFVAPIVIGGRDAPSPVAGLGAPRLPDAWRLRDLSAQKIGEDILLSGYPAKERDIV